MRRLVAGRLALLRSRQVFFARKIRNLRIDNRLEIGQALEKELTHGLTRLQTASKSHEVQWKRSIKYSSAASGAALHCRGSIPMSLSSSLHCSVDLYPSIWDPCLVMTLTDGHGEEGRRGGPGGGAPFRAMYV